MKIVRNLSIALAAVLAFGAVALAQERKPEEKPGAQMGCGEGHAARGEHAMRERHAMMRGGHERPEHGRHQEREQRGEPR